MSVRAVAVRSRSTENVTDCVSGLGREAPLWVPDSASASCQECSKLFSFLVRRHHCRSCGRLLCSPCSSYTSPLQYLNWVIARVCLSCKENLDSPSRPQRRSRSLTGISTQEENISKLVREMQMESFRQRSLEGLRSDSPISSLPKEILSKIFNLLGHSDKKVCRSVSQFWMQVIETSSFYRESLVHLKDISPERFKLESEIFNSAQFDNFRFSRLTLSPNFKVWEEIGDRIKIFELFECEITERELTYILLSLRNLRGLAVVNCRDVFMSGTFLSSLPEKEEVYRNLNQLRSLKLDNNKYLSDVLLMRITEAAPNLKSLSLSGCNIMNDAGIYLKHYPESQEIHASPSVLTWRILVKVVQRLASTLTSLDISKNTGVDLLMLAAVYGLNLTKLNIFSCGSVTQPGLMRILISNPNLGSINLACCRRVFSGLPDGTVTIFNEMKVNEINLSQLSIPYFRSIGTLKGLKSLEINGLDSPGSEILKGLEGLETTSLSTLKARFLGVPVQDLTEVIMKKDFSRLRRLDLSSGGDNTVTDKLVQVICSNMQGLTHLNLSNNPRISDIGTLGLSLENPASNSVLEMKELMYKKNKIPLGSRHENEIRLAGLRREIMTESLLEDGMLESGLFLLSRLQELNLSLTSVSSLTLKLGVNAPDLRSFCLDNCAAIDDSGLYDFAIRHSHLEKLQLGSTRVTDTGLISCLSCLPRLVHLDISSCQDVTSAGLRAVGQVSPQIETLLLSNCSNISVEAARTVELSLPNLKHIQTLGLLSERRAFPSHYNSQAPPPPPPPRRN